MLSFCGLKFCIKNKFMNQIVNNIRLARNLMYVENIKNMQFNG